MRLDARASRHRKNPSCELRDLQQSWEYFRHADLYKLSAVDADAFADHEARANSACIHVRPPFRCSRVQVCGIVKDWAAEARAGLMAASR